MALVPANNLSKFQEGARRFASGFTRGQKAATISALVGILVVAVLFMSLSSKPTYSILFTNLKASDAATITQTLATDKVPYQLEDGGTTILVPENDVDQQRLAIAALGLPSQATAGLSILDKEGLTTSQLTQQADYLQAIQGELEQTIDSITGVESSQVNVAESANQTFALGNSNPTGASVLVNLAQGTTLTYSQVQAITSLVASSVPGLTIGNVTVADNNGDLLAGPGVSASGQQTSAAAAYDSATQAKVVAYLTSVLGQNNADVQVNAVLNFNSVKTDTQTIVTGANGKALTTCTNNSTSSTKYTGSGNPPGSTVTQSVTGTGTYTQTQKQTTCESGTQNQTVVQAPGTVTNQSVAVLVNSKALPAGVSTATLKAGVAAAAGIQASRGDVLSFSAVPFASTAVAATTTKKASPLTTLAKPALSFLLVVLTLFLLWRTSRKARKQNLARDGLLDTLGFDPFAAAGLDPITAELPAVPIGGQPQLTSVQDIVDNQAEEVAQVLRSWLQHTP
jgi:flagellar M-ring protein FliF